MSNMEEILGWQVDWLVGWFDGCLVGWLLVWLVATPVAASYFFSTSTSTSTRGPGVLRHLCGKNASVPFGEKMKTPQYLDAVVCKTQSFVAQNHAHRVFGHLTGKECFGTLSNNIATPWPDDAVMSHYEQKMLRHLSKQH